MNLKTGSNTAAFSIVSILLFGALEALAQTQQTEGNQTVEKVIVLGESNEYSKLYRAQSELAIFEKMWFFTNDFQEHFAKKTLLKKKLKFWKS